MDDLSEQLSRRIAVCSFILAAFALCLGWISSLQGNDGTFDAVFGLLLTFNGWAESRQRAD
jgi:hypothetical protein